jgi:hypothetical protein
LRGEKYTFHCFYILETTTVTWLLHDWLTNSFQLELNWNFTKQVRSIKRFLDETSKKLHLVGICMETTFLRISRESCNQIYKLKCIYTRPNYVQRHAHTTSQWGIWPRASPSHTSLTASTYVAVVVQDMAG